METEIVEGGRQTDRQMAADKCFQAQLKGDYFDGLLLSRVCESVSVCVCVSNCENVYELKQFVNTHYFESMFHDL